MSIPKVPYLQYEILEYFYLKPDTSLEEYVGFPKQSKIIGSALEKLIQKKMLNRDMYLTEMSSALVKKHVQERYGHKYYNGLSLFQSNQEQTSFLTPESNNGNDKIFKWYKYLEDFPHSFIDDSISKYKLNKKFKILDPFVGSGTTLIEAKLNGFDSLGFDVNPVMTFVANSKLNWNMNVEELKKVIVNLINLFKITSEKEFKQEFNNSNLVNMPKKELNQWLSPVKQKQVGFMLNALSKLQIKQDIKDLVKFIISTSALNASYVAFCPGTTFYPFRKRNDFIEEFIKLSQWVIEDLSDPTIQNKKNIKSEIYEISSKNPSFVKQFSNKVDLIITSPPYPNDLEYTRQTRLELYMLGFVKNMSDVKNLKKKMVKGSTKLIFKEDKIIDSIQDIKSIKLISNQVKENLKDKNWGFDYPRMIEQYFSDMWICMENYYNTLVNGGTCILVVGDQTSKGVLIPVAEILEEIGQKIGYKQAKIELHRNRRSSGHDIPIPEENLILTK